ncbi:MAG: transposase, partial [Acetobacteraceae bacterium]|nr:transposase [Acetobacteraceae bacterium]
DVYKRQLHARVDARGLPVRLALSAGKAADMRAVPELLAGLAPGCDVVADRGYDYTEVRQRIRAAGSRDHVPTTRQKARTKLPLHRRPRRHPAVDTI